MEENVLDLEVCKSQEVNEAYMRYSLLGQQVKEILKAMFGGYSIPLQVKGSQRDVDSFMNTLGKEKRYMDAYMSFGLSDPKTYKSKYELQRAVKDFQNKTGLTWPFSF